MMVRIELPARTRRFAVACAGFSAAMFACIRLAGAVAPVAATGVGVLGEPTLVGTSAPANVPREYVVTPNGYFHPSCVQRLGNDETLRRDVGIVSANGSLRAVPRCAYPHYAADGTPLDPDEAPAPPAMHVQPLAAPVVNGWVAAAEYVLPRTAPARLISARMSVPSAPTVPAGQTIYFFPGLEDIEHVVTIVQPVLAWNGFNDHAWSIASWNCCLNGQTWHSPPVAVAAGTTILGTVRGVRRCSTSACQDWSIVTTDMSNGHSTKLATAGYDQAFDWVFGAVLEAYGVTACTHYPATGSEDFTDISVLGATFVTRTWSRDIIDGSLACGYAVQPYPDADSPNVMISY
jgi:hypothetical protein